MSIIHPTFKNISEDMIFHILSFIHPTEVVCINKFYNEINKKIIISSIIKIQIWYKKTSLYKFGTWTLNRIDLFRCQITKRCIKRHKRTKPIIKV
jgi:hypothetical protein